MVARSYAEDNHQMTGLQRDETIEEKSPQSLTSLLLRETIEIGDHRNVFQLNFHHHSALIFRLVAYKVVSICVLRQNHRQMWLRAKIAVNPTCILRNYRKMPKSFPRRPIGELQN